MNPEKRKHLINFIEKYALDETFVLPIQLERDSEEEAKQLAEEISQLLDVSYVHIENQGYAWYNIELAADVIIAIHITDYYKDIETTKETDMS